MESADELTKAGDDYCFAKTGEIYAVYLPEGKSTEILLPSGQFSVLWFNPRTGGDLVTGTIDRINGSRYSSIGSPPGDPGKDWVCLIKHIEPSL